MLRKILTFMLLIAVLSACAPTGAHSVGADSENGSGNVIDQPVTSKASINIVEPTQVKAPETKVAADAAASAATATNVAPATASTASPTAASAATGATKLGPDQFPDGINPLTGLPVKNPANLALSPALVSVTNFPVTARPQAGLSFSPFVYEMYIGEGMTRFLALFYGDYPEKGQNKGIALGDDRVGPIRSGRLPYESLRKLYNGFLVMSASSSVVTPSLSSYATIYGSDNGDINSTMIPATKLAEIASKNPDRLKKDALSGLSFDSSLPDGGKTAKGIWIPFSFLNQVLWRYDPSSGAYLRYQDNADGKTFIQASDRLNQKPLTYSNVVVLFANHIAKRETLIDINLMYIDKMPALLFRDGKMYQVYWTTANSDYEKRTGLVRPIRFIDAQGNPFPLKPGQTWVEVVQQNTPYNETVDSQNYLDLKTKSAPGSGMWAIQFYPTIPERK